MAFCAPDSFLQTSYRPGSLMMFFSTERECDAVLALDGMIFRGSKVCASFFVEITGRL